MHGMIPSLADALRSPFYRPSRPFGLDRTNGNGKLVSSADEFEAPGAILMAATKAASKAPGAPSKLGVGLGGKRQLASVPKSKTSGTAVPEGYKVEESRNGLPARDPGTAIEQRRKADGGRQGE